MTLTLLQVSDLHFEDSQWTDTQPVFKGLLEDLKHLREKDGIKPDLVLFSGDLINSAETSTSLDQVHDRIVLPLLDANSLTRDALLIAPGNHDINRELVRKNLPVQAGLIQTLKDRSACNDFYDKNKNEPIDHFYFSRLQAYSQYASQFARRYEIRRNRFVSAFNIPLENNINLGVAVLNTAWLATGEPNDADRTHLIVPEHAILEAANDIEPCAFKIAVFHHPLDYFAAHNRSDCRALLQKHFDLVCTGHLHEAMPEKRDSPLGRAIFSEAGALYSSREFYNGYCIIQVDFGSLRAKVISRRWEDARFSFGPATNLSDDGGITFPWGNPAEVKRIGELIDISRALKPMLIEQANEHILSAYASTNAPKAFTDMYVDLPVANHSNSYDPGVSELIKYWSADDILKSSQPVVIFGGRETGKTMLAYHLSLEVCDSAYPPIRVPVFLDLSVATGRNGFRRQRRCSA